MPQIAGIPNVDYLSVVQKPELPALMTVNGSTIVVKTVAFGHSCIVILLDAAVWEHQLIQEGIDALVKKAMQQWLLFMQGRHPGVYTMEKLQQFRAYNLSDSFPDHTTTMISISM